MAKAAEEQQAAAEKAAADKDAALTAAIEKAIQTTYKKPWKAADIQAFNAKEKKAFERKFKTLKKTIDKEKLTTKGWSAGEVEAAKSRFGIK